MNREDMFDVLGEISEFMERMYESVKAADSKRHYLRWMDAVDLATVELRGFYMDADSMEDDGK